jgi:UDP-3-O-[3-hydroxymyristoyl] glucosamine N-acyltransferase
MMLVGLTLGTNVAIADQSVATGKVKPEAPRASAKPARPLSYEEQEAIIRRKEEMQERVAEEELKKAKRARERH